MCPTLLELCEYPNPVLCCTVFSERSCLLASPRVRLWVCRKLRDLCMYPKPALCCMYFQKNCKRNYMRSCIFKRIFTEYICIFKRTDRSPAEGPSRVHVQACRSCLGIPSLRCDVLSSRGDAGSPVQFYYCTYALSLGAVSVSTVYTAMYCVHLCD